MSSITINKTIASECAYAPPLKYFSGLSVLFIVSCLIPHTANALVAPIFQYVFNAVLVETYGYTRTRRILWIGLASTALALGISLLAHLSYPGLTWPDIAIHETKQTTLISKPALLVFENVGFVSFWIVAFVNSYVWAKMKLLMQGRHLWARVLGSLAAGRVITDLVLSAVVTFSFAAVISSSTEISIRIIRNHFYWASAFALICAAFAAPLIYILAGWLKRSEGTDTNP